MDFSGDNVTPMMAAVIVLVAIAVLVGISFTFQGNIQF